MIVISRRLSPLLFISVLAIAIFNCKLALADGGKSFFSPSEFFNPEKMNSWKPNGYARDLLDFEKLKKLSEPSCSNQLLYPAHPLQATKSYHLYEVAEYKRPSLTRDDYACSDDYLRPPVTNGKRLYCAIYGKSERAIISDLYVDACGNLYRGFWKVSFLKRDENMGSLLSKGRRVYEREDSLYKGSTKVRDMEDFGTYEVEMGDLLFLTPPFEGDGDLVRKYLKMSEIEFTRDPKSPLLFIKR